MPTNIVSDIVHRAESNLSSFNLDAPFLYTDAGMLSYRKLSIWCQMLEEQIEQTFDQKFHQPVVVVCGKPTDSVLALIAAGWLLGWKIVPLPSNLKAIDIDNRLQRLSADIILTDIEHRPLFDDNGKLLTTDQLPSPFEITFEMGTAWSEEEWIERRLYDPHEVFGYFFTSGTTGKPKCVPLRRRQMLSAVMDADASTRPEHGEAWLHCLPINHIGGYSIVLRSLLYGSSVYALPDGFDTEEVARLLAEDERVVLVSLVPTMLRRLLEIEDFEVHERFKSILLGGASTSPELIEDAVEREIPITVSYGMTETCAQIAAHPFRDQFDLSDPLDSVGFLFASNKISIRIDLKDPASQDGNGYIWLRGPQVITEYWDPDDTEASFDEEGWFNTGDIGHTDDDGRLYIASRRSDLIITGGENVRPHRVETAILRTFGAIDSCAVVGQPDEEWGQRIVALCVMDPIEEEVPFSIDEMRKRLRDELRPFELPRAVAFVQTLPKTTSGKVKRHELLDLLADEKINLDIYNG